MSLNVPENNILSTQGLTKDLDGEGGGVLPILTNTGMLGGFGSLFRLGYYIYDPPPG